MKLLVCFFLFFCGVLNASKVNVFVKNGSWGEVKMLIYEEHFTKHKSIFSMEKLDTENKAVFDLKVDKPTRFSIEIGRFSSDIFVLPNEDYEFYVYPYEQRVEIISDDNDNTNDLIDQLEEDLKKYGSNNLTTDFASSSFELENLEEFIEKLQRKYRRTGGKFFQRYKFYTIQRYQLDIAKKTQNIGTIDTMLDSIIVLDAINYQNPSQIEFLKYWHYVKFYGFEYKYGIGEYDRLKAIARQSKNPELRQLLELNAIDIAFRGNFDNLHLCGDDLDSISGVILNDDLDFMAYNLKEKYYKFSQGARAPSISYKDNYGSLFNLEDYIGQVVYIGFWTMWNSSSVEDLEQIQKLKRHFKDDIVFVSILVDNNLETLKRFLDQKGYDWTFLSTGINSSVKEDCGINQFPKYMIIGTNGDILEPLADRPSEETLIELEQIIKAK